MYGFAVAAWPVGAILSGLAAATLIRQMGSARLAVLGTVGTALAAIGAGVAPTYVLFVACLLFGGAMDAVTDVSQNAQALTVQKRYPRSIFNSFHATWSIGAAGGGLMAAGAISIHLPINIHLGISGITWAVVALIAHRFASPRKLNVTFKRQLGPNSELQRFPSRPCSYSAPSSSLGSLERLEKTPGAHGLPYT